MQKLGKSPNFGVISEIQRVKFWAFVTDIFGGKIWGSNKNSEANFGAKPPDLLILKYPPQMLKRALCLLIDRSTLDVIDAMFSPK